MTDAPTKHPILRLQVLAPDGTRATDHVVFCQLQGQSVRVEECCRCLRCDGIEDGPTPAVVCTLPHEPVGGGDGDGERERDGEEEEEEEDRAEHTAVGSLLYEGTLVIAHSVSLGTALELLRAHDRRSVAIVDERHVMVGLVHELDVLGRAARLREDVVAASMAATVSIDEGTSVKAALRLLAAHHLREATVVSKRGVPIGVFRDVDGLHWIATLRSGVTEPRER